MDSITLIHLLNQGVAVTIAIYLVYWITNHLKSKLDTMSEYVKEVRDEVKQLREEIKDELKQLREEIKRITLNQGN